MFATAVTLALFGFILTMVVDVIRRDGRKIVAALEGRPWIADPAFDYPVTVRFSPRFTMAEPAPSLPPVLRAAA